MLVSRAASREFLCLLGSYSICSAVSELILFPPCCFYYDGFIHIGAGGSLAIFEDGDEGDAIKAGKEWLRFQFTHV